VRIGALSVRLVPGCMLILTNIDRPGVVGQVGTFLGKNNINIAQMQVARKDAGARR